MSDVLIPARAGARPVPSSTQRQGCPAAKRRAVCLAVLMALAGTLTACGSTASASTPAPGCAPGTPRLTVEATGQASASPDTLTISIGVDVSDPTAVAALSDANDRATTLTGALRGSGVTAADVQSTNFSIFPKFALSGAITGYEVSNTLLVTLHNLSDAGQVVDTAGSSVGNAIRINGLAFAVSNTGNVDGQARAAAVTTAAAHARAMATAAHRSLRGICSISDSTTGPSPDLSGTAFNSSVAGVPPSAVPLEPGTQQASAQVTVVYVVVPKSG
ncbi:MAG TPA: SIMPL domain-containing protein [Acidimicrobiales bacterium]|nr:SIMPL domain-containing protein [Acidimicrobiales bacterium]